MRHPFLLPFLILFLLSVTIKEKVGIAILNHPGISAELIRTEGKDVYRTFTNPFGIRAKD